MNIHIHTDYSVSHNIFMCFMIRHSGVDPIKLNCGKKAQQGRSH